METQPGLTLPASELQQARLYLRQTCSYIIGATKGLSEAQWKFKPAPDCWSIAEILDHVIAVQEFVLGPVRAQLASSPAPPANRDYKHRRLKPCSPRYRVPCAPGDPLGIPAASQLLPLCDGLHLVEELATLHSSIVEHFYSIITPRGRRTTTRARRSRPAAVSQ